MKLQYIFLSLFFLAATFSVNAQNAKGITKDTVKVWGECGMCKKTIEKSALSAGATTANWNTETKILTLSYSGKKTSSDKIQQAIAAAGYDTKAFTASQDAYDKLHECCKYERKEANTAVEKKCCSDDKKGECCKKGTDSKPAEHGQHGGHQ